MSETAEVDYGPLTGLIGVWSGDKGIDIAPDPDGEENNPYYETITFSACGSLKNAESQELAHIHYRQIVKRKSNDEIFHDETGYWMWDARAQTIMHSLTIPRAVCILAGAKYVAANSNAEKTVLEVSAHVEDHYWKIIQSPFMVENALTTEFKHRISVGTNTLSYFEMTRVEIYGKTFEHTDENTLTRQ